MPCERLHLRYNSGEFSEHVMEEMMKNPVALIIIYNHSYEKNIALLEKIYSDKFTTILHLMPFYTGTKENVIPIYENPHRFHGYIAQSKQALLNTSCDTFVFAADDLLINPELCEENILDTLGIPADHCYLPCFSIGKINSYWAHAIKALHFFNNAAGCEGVRALPDKEAALRLITRHLPQYCLDVSTSAFFKEGVPENIPQKMKLPYPLIGGYSDFFIVTRPALTLFAHYCGIFSAMNLFVEIALPTALAFSTRKISKTFGNGYTRGEIWEKEKLDELKLQHDLSLDKLLNEFPSKKAYLHPIKLSEWS